MIDFKNIKSWKIGNTEIAKASINGVVVWQKNKDPYSEPFYVEDLSGSENTVQIAKSYDQSPTITIEKSTDGKSWTSMGSTSTTAITATIPANGKLYLRCNTTAWGSTSRYSGNQIKATGSHKVGGNIMSLLYGTNFTGDEITFPSDSPLTVYELFKNDTYLMDASGLLLPATTLTKSCYGSMFYGCTGLTAVPTLPATTLANGCYSYMFRDCTSLTSVPELPATTLAQACYRGMFYSCRALTTAPTLPATTLAHECYGSMFYGCTALDWVSPLMLPATNMVNQCYAGMFEGCISLVTAPELPATTIRDSCYNNMFNGCASLIEVMMMAVEWDMSDTSNWLNGVSETGTIILNKNATFDLVEYRGNASGIPQEWEILSY